MNRTATWIAMLSLAAILFGWQAYKAWTGPLLPEVSPPEEETEALRTKSSLEKEVPGGNPPISIASIIARPLFRPDRSPYQENGAVLPGRNYQAELSRLTVLGVLLLGEEQKAVITDKTPGQSNRWEVGSGDTIPGFVVTEVLEDGVLLEADGRTFTLPLYGGAPPSSGRNPVRTETAPPGTPATTRPPPAVSSQGPSATPPVRRFRPRRIYRPGRR